MKQKKKLQTAKDILMSRDFLDRRTKSAKYVNHEFQDFGLRLAVQLDDMDHKSLYIKLAKNTKRAILQQALSFAKDYPKAKNKGKIFMWKLSELRNLEKEQRKTQGGNFMMNI